MKANFVVLLLMSQVVASELLPHYLKSKGEGLTIKCPKEHEECEVTWEVTRFSGESGNLGHSVDLVFDSLDLWHSGRYTCSEDAITSEGRQRVQHVTNVLVMEVECKPKAESEGVHCEMIYKPDADHRLEAFQMCETTQYMGIPVKWNRTVKEPNFKRHELILEESDCLVAVTYADSMLVVWLPPRPPTTSDSLLCPRSPNSLPGGLDDWLSLQSLREIILTILNVLTIAFLTASLICVCRVRSKLKKYCHEVVYRKNDHQYIEFPPASCHYEYMEDLEQTMSFTTTDWSPTRSFFRAVK